MIEHATFFDVLMTGFTFGNTLIAAVIAIRQSGTRRAIADVHACLDEHRERSKEALIAIREAVIHDH